MTTPVKEIESRKTDLSKVLLPELMPDQLHTLGITQFDGEGNEFYKAKSHIAAGMSLIELIHRRVNKVIENGELYNDRQQNGLKSQAALVQENIAIFFYQAAQLRQLMSTATPASEAQYKIIDALIETALSIGYYTGGNDTLAVTDRYVEHGYTVKVINPQKGGKTKSAPTEPLKQLVNEMAEFAYTQEKTAKVAKAMLAEAINHVLINFSNINDNRNLPALIKFPSRAPEIASIQTWFKRTSRAADFPYATKPQLNKVVDVLSKQYTPAKIMRYLKQKNKNPKE